MSFYGVYLRLPGSPFGIGTLMPAAYASILAQLASNKQQLTSETETRNVTLKS